MNKERKAIIESNEISEIRTYKLGGFNQKVMFDGKSKESPIILFLHGGPGAPIPFGEGCRGLFPKWTDKVIMVYWDQLGCGVNNHEIDDSFKIADFVDMTVELVKKIKEDFPQNKLYLFGVSWGSVLTAETAFRVPELLEGAFTYGQILKDLTFNDETFETLENSNIKGKDKAKLELIKAHIDNPSTADTKTVMGFVRKYTEGYTAKSGGKTDFGKIVRGMFTSPDYTIKDFMACVISGYSKNSSIITSLRKIDLSDDFAGMKTPYYIMQGSTDIVTSTKTIKAYVNGSDNKNLHFKEIENSGHMPSSQAMDIIVKSIFEVTGVEKAEAVAAE